MANPNNVTRVATVVPREDSILGIRDRSAKYFLTEAEQETIKKKKEKIEYINTEIERRRTAFEIV